MSISAWKEKLSQQPWHMLLLILFFLLNGYSYNLGLVPLPDLLLYGLMVAGTTLIAFYICCRIYKDRLKAGLLLTAALFLFLFYGVLQDALVRLPVFQKISRDHWLVPLLGTLLLLLAIVLKLLRRAPLTFFLNCLLLIYVLVELGAITWKSISIHQREVSKSSIGTNQCDTCLRPDIYLLLLDEYAGSRSLQQWFGVSNQRFEDGLRARGFFVAASPASNYSYTPFSMSSLFNMDYLVWSGKDKDIDAKHYTKAANEISGSAALKELKKQGYTLRNLSIFDIQDEPAAYDQGFMALKLRLVTDKTLWGRIRKSLFWQFGKKGGWADRIRWEGARQIGEGNASVIRQTIELASDTVKREPQFVYTHLLMPHPPYLFDSLGKPRDDGYVSYLKYTNRVVEDLVDKIIRGENGQAVIMVMSDHGFRNAGGARNVKDLNNNFNAVFLPAHNYHYFYDSISNVNQFRVLFNSLFDSRYPVLRDSTVF